MSHKTKITKIRFYLHRIYKRLLGLRTFGVRLIVLNDNNQVLLVKHSYRPGYFFPGGGIDKGEEILDAAKRELFEETNLKANIFELQGIYRFFQDKHDDTVVTFKVTDIQNISDLKIDEAEIIDAKWFELDSLPSDLSVGTQFRIEEVLSSDQIHIKNWVDS